MVESLIEELISAAVVCHTSDIYILPHQAGYQIRWRQATALSVWRTVTMAVGRQLITYFKFHADMAVSEQRRPQVGALTWPGEPPVELRFSTVGDYANQESMVIRLIYPYLATSSAYLIPEQQDQLAVLAERRGLILFAGPTGAGKTTTMYMTASRLDNAAMILTVEDPVEIKETQFVQLQVNPAAGLSYEALIKVGLRHRPDAFIIGEIRDYQTAQAAVRAALSGHLVLSTVHAQTAAGTINRLLDLGVTSSQLHQVLTAACYQRLIPQQDGRSAVLLDILSGAELWQPVTTMTERWRRALEHAATDQKISAATVQQFQAG